MPAALPVDGPIRVGVVGLGQIAELMLPPYLAHPDIEIVALCDANEERLDRWRAELPHATGTTDLDELLARDDLHVVDVLVPTPLHAEIGRRVLAAGHHMQLQKPITRNLDDCDALLEIAEENGAFIRVLEDYIFFPPLVKLKEIVESGELGEPVGLHMKVVNTGRGGWDVLPSAYVWQLEQTADGRGMVLMHEFECAELDACMRELRWWLRSIAALDPPVDPRASEWSDSIARRIVSALREPPAPERRNDA